MSVIMIYNIEVNVRVVGYFLTAGITRRKGQEETNKGKDCRSSDCCVVRYGDIS